MKYLLSLFLFFCILSSFSLYAQISAGTLTEKNGHVYWSNIRMQKNELEMFDYFDIDNYKAGRTMIVSGITSMSVGGAGFVMGTVNLALFIDNNKKPQEQQSSSDSYKLLTIIGFGSAVILESLGIPLYIGGRGKIRDVVQQHNFAVHPELAFGPCRSGGLGLALNF